MDSGKACNYGRDNHGRPICFGSARLHDTSIRDLNEVGLNYLGFRVTHSDLWPWLQEQMFCVWSIEQMQKSSPIGVSRNCFVFDLAGFAMKNMDYQFSAFMIHMFQNYYPDTLGVAYVLNAPWLFSSCWAILKRWIDPETERKVQFVKLPVLQTHIDISQMPTSLGGPWEYDPDALLIPAETS